MKATSVFLFVLVVWLPCRLVWPCSCAPFMARQALADPQIEQVFLGEVVALEVTTRERFGMTFRFHLVTLVPRTIWKGPVSATIELLTPHDGTACGQDFSQTGEYLVFAYRLNEELQTDECQTYGPGGTSQMIDELGEPTWRSEPGSPFVRGDANADGSRDLSDAVFLLNSLFQGGTPPTCLDAADTDDSGTLQITDAIALLNALFLGAPPPPPPGPERCGTDPTADALDCSSFGSCP